MKKTGKFAGITGFISCRELGRELMNRLYLELDTRKIDVGCWRNLPPSNDDHQTAVAKHIGRSAFAVIIRDKTNFDNRGKEGTCAQLKEVRHIGSRDNQLDDARKFRIWQIILQDANGRPTTSELHTGTEDWLDDHQNTKSYGGVGVEADAEFCQEIASDIEKWLGDNLEHVRRKSPAKAKPSADATADAAAALAELESKEAAYLETVAPNWASSNSQAGALDFNIAYSVIPRGIHEGADNLVTHWLFSADQPPLLLRGGPGTGKRSTILAAAAVFACQQDTRFERLLNSEPAKKWLKAAERLQGVPFMPVVLKAEAIAQLSKGKVEAEHIVEAVAAELYRCPASSKLQCDTIEQRMKTQPYAIFVDGLDLLRTTKAATDVARALFNLSVRVGPHLKIVATNRAALPESRMSDLELQRLRDDQIAEFVTNFVKERYQKPAEREQAAAKLKRAQDELRHKATDPSSYAAAEEVLRYPITLNAFCRATMQRAGGFAERRVALSKELLDAIITADIELSNGALVTAAETRALLQLLALKAMGSAFSPHKAMSQISAWTAGRPAFRGPEIISELLGLVAEKTGLLVESPTFEDSEFGFSATFWAEQLAGEALAADPMLLQAMLNEMAPDKMLAQSRVFSNALSLVLSSDAPDRIERALDIPLGILRRAETCREDGDTASVARLVCAASDALSGGASRCMDEGAEVAAKPLGEAYRSASKLYASTWQDWSLQQRDLCLTNLARSARRHEDWATTHRLLDKILGEARWASLGNGSGAQIAARPVLSSDYDAFLRSLDERSLDVDRLFDHARSEDDRLRLDQDAAAGAGGSMHDLLAAQRSRPGAPVMYITWFEAVAYCRWLTDKLRVLPVAEGIGPHEIIRLPTYEECKTLMRRLAGEGNYPWGASKAPGEGDKAKANCREAGIGRVTSLGVFGPVITPSSEALWDFGSNVRIWTTPSVGRGETWWPRELSYDAAADVFGAAWSSPQIELKENAGRQLPALQTRSRQIGMRLVRASKAS